MNSSGPQSRTARFNAKVFKVALDLDLKPKLEALRPCYTQPLETTLSDRILLRRIIEGTARSQSGDQSSTVVHDGESKADSPLGTVMPEAAAATQAPAAASSSQQQPSQPIPVGHDALIPNAETPKLFHGGQLWVADGQLLVAFQKPESRREILRDQLDFAFDPPSGIWWRDMANESEALLFIAGLHRYMEEFPRQPSEKEREELLRKTLTYLRGQPTAMRDGATSQ